MVRFLGWPVPPLYVSVPCVGCVVPWVRVRKLVEAELTMTMKMKVVKLDERTPRRQFLYIGDPSRN